MGKKRDLNKIVTDIQRLYNKKPATAERMGVGDNLKSLADGNFLEMPPWWKAATNTKGLPLGGYVMLAGDSDSGKTSAAVQAMKAAQDQDFTVLYVETENKTTKEDLQTWGVDTSQVMLAKSAIAEEAFDMLFHLWDGFEKDYPDDKLLVIFDSIGNIVSRHDMNSDMMDTNQKPGGKGKTNRAGINKLIAKLQSGNVTALLLNYTYDNIGSPGKTNAGGKALNFFSSMTYQTSRKQWLEKTVKGEKVRIGARVQWRLFKNHIDKTNPGPKNVEIDITSDGMTVAGQSAED